MSERMVSEAQAWKAAKVVKPAFTLVEANALARLIDRDHWEEFPEMLRAFDVLESGKFEFTLEEADGLLTVCDPDAWPEDAAMVAGCLKLRQAKADAMGQPVERVNRTLGWSV